MKAIPSYDVETRLVTLHGPDVDQGPWRMRGAVCLPSLHRQANGPLRSLSGVVLVAGQKRDGSCEVFLEGEFHVVRPAVIDGRLMDPGVVTWYRRGQMEWMCREYLHANAAEDARQHMAELRGLSSAELSVPVSLIDVCWEGDGSGAVALLEWLRGGKLRYPDGGVVHKALGRYMVNPAEPDPGAYAAMVLAYGARKFPVRS